METIISAACKFSFKDTSKADLITTGNNHADCINWLSFADIPYISIDKSKTIQGFMTSKNRFVSRYEAYQIAEAANQLSSIRSDKILYSEYVNYRKDD